ncbi:hypothetical protein Kpol_1052p19 [Vanderwaltozyma polyspora DSM 70294]|uniref:RING-type domain-containing protein n=1 Tax=Vanderwaltozyma polyspora (strain ATCC 22028 / DSM 70294 / BCRC 21397 / CBS 2163 / NBRC 10782 / NRRL Y-8283 / UCD 57-17) TaxID=436907 RepID=A7TM30_VANPO|nr:uncharacterized protein Kpol_1052p19 [Vanderwaltozyma polyspora DSM 70294]EDO16672.1 hypothetical protein Kpol_1052p19 [Vanderwaltozyma polyspora DSM 70294]
MNDNSSEKGCSESFISSLPRLKLSDLKDPINDSCSICCCTYADDKYPLISKLPHCGHNFDYECLSIWLSKNKTCPMCRDDITSHKEVIDTSNVELEEDWGMYG